MSNKKHLIDTIRLSRTQNIGPITFVKLLEQFGNPSNAIDNLSAIIKNSKKKFDIFSKSMAEKEIEIAEKNNIKLIDYTSEFYPPLLKNLQDFPAILYCKGHVKLLKKTSFAIVGSRNASILGKKNAFNFAKELGDYGFLITSGMAMGIDTSAHKGAIEKGTVAVLGCGVDQIYPKENKELYENIIERGVVISEFPIGTPPEAYNFPKRNRIISGMSRGVLIVEATNNSGSIITAKMALEQGADIFAIPGSPGDTRSNGTNQLIKEGAILTENVMDIVNILKTDYILRETNDKYENNMYKVNEYDINQLNNVTSYLLNNLSSSPISVDLIIEQNRFTPYQLYLGILELELLGQIERHPNNKISLIQPIE